MPRTNVDMTARSIRRFNDWLRGEMRRKKINQAVVAEYLNMAQQGVSLRLRGLCEWKLREVLDICEYFGVRIEEII